MIEAYESTPFVFVMAIVVFAFTAFMIGHIIASGWKPMWLAMIYCVILAIGFRILAFALAGGDVSIVLSLPGFVLDVAVLAPVCALAYRMNWARGMARQYPWLYARTGPFTWRRIASAAGGEAGGD